MHTEQNHYETLGLPKTASAADIKKRYRQLARKYHPDVAKDKESAAKIFVRITEAYKTLVDPEKRWMYDSTLPEPASIRPPSSAARPSSTVRPAVNTRIAVDKLIKDAEMAFIKKRLIEAKSLCREALKLDRSCARAHAVLGDVYRAQKHYESAINEYNYAVQLQPGDMDSQKKLEKLIERSAPVDFSWDVPDNRPSAKVIALNALGWAIAVFALPLISIYPGEPISFLSDFRLAWINTWSWNLVGMMFGEGVLVGFLLGINGIVNHPDDELIFESTDRTWTIVPAGLILLFFGPIFFIAAAGIYLLFAIIQNSVSKAVLKVFLATVVIVYFSALLYSRGVTSVLIFGGNVVFTGMLFGWYIGSMFCLKSFG
ncbi:MAG: DnaJ domain-containing protein [Armatimonadota bacterium]